MSKRDNTSIVRGFSDLKRDYRSDYDASTPSRFRRQRTGLYGTGDAHYASERKFFETIEYVRDAERNDPLIRAALNLVVNQVIQGGFVYEPKTDDKQLNSEIAAWHKEWADDPNAVDAAGQQDFAGAQKMVCRSMIRDGDMLIIPLESGHCQFLESERLKSPKNSKRNIVHGVELNDLRRPVRFWVTKQSVDPLSRVERVGEFTPYAAYDEEGQPNVFHVLDPDRVTQSRGVSAFVAAQLRLGMIDDTEFATLLKHQMAACLLATIESDQQAGGYTAREDLGARETVKGDSGDDMVLETVNAGLIKRLPPGKRFMMHSPVITSAESMDHVKRMMQIVGLQVGLPLVMLMLDASETNFSGFKGAVDTARGIWREWQRHQARRFHSPLACWRLRAELSESGEFARGLRTALKRLKGRLFAHQWHYPTWRSIQPMEEAKAKALRLATLQTSPRRSVAEEGMNWEDVIAETVADNSMAIGLAIKEADKLNAGQSTPLVHWRDLLNRDLYSGGSVTDSVDVANASAPAAGGAKK